MRHITRPKICKINHLRQKKTKFKLKLTSVIMSYQKQLISQYSSDAKKSPWYPPKMFQQRGFTNEFFETCERKELHNVIPSGYQKDAQLRN